jgi:hypothetical protein
MLTADDKNSRHLIFFPKAKGSKETTSEIKFIDTLLSPSNI